MELGLGGRVAFVAAASRGLGRAIAEALAAEGASIACCARSPGIRAAADELEQRFRVPVLGIVADVAVPADVARAVAATVERFGRIDILVTNAGGPPPGPFESHTDDAWQRAIALNLGSVVNLVRAVVTGFARTLANEVAPFHVTVNNLMPGYTRTERLEQLAEANAKSKGTTREAAFAQWEQQIPMGRVGEPHEFAALAAFLASERASYITAQSIAVDGGWIKSLL